MTSAIIGYTCTIANRRGLTDDWKHRIGDTCTVLDSGFTIHGFRLLLECEDGEVWCAALDDIENLQKPT